MFVQLSLIKEFEAGGEKWRSFFNRVWPFYNQWFLSEGYLKRPGYLTSFTEFERFMPELLPAYEQLCQAVGGDDIKARFLSMYCPPAYMSGCSQIAWTKKEAALIRNYDYHPRYFDGTVFYSNFLKPVIGMTDCTWGLLDGINEDGLAVSLTFGGRKIIGIGFGIPIIIRYLLETCSTVEEAVKAVKTIPTHMAYNLTIVDTKGDFCSAYLRPDKPTRVVDDPVATNHQGVVEWKEYAAFSKTVERKHYLEECFKVRNDGTDTILNLFLKPPLYHTDYEKSFGTLYTAAYKTKTKEMIYAWPRKKVVLDFNNFPEQKIQVNLKNLIPKHI